MAIIVKHSGNMGSTALAAYRGGKGRRQAEDGRQALSVAASDRRAREGADLQREQAKSSMAFQERMRDENRSFQVEQSGEQRKHASRMAEEQRDFSVQQSDLSAERRTEDQRRQASINDRLDQRRQSRRIESARQESRERAEDEYVRQEKAYEDARESGKYSDEEMKEFRKQLDKRRMGIEEEFGPPGEESTSAEDAFRDRTYKDPETGVIYPIDRHGGVGRPIFDPRDSGVTPAERRSAYDTAFKIAEKEAGEGDAIDMDRVRELTREILGETDEPKESKGSTSDGEPVDNVGILVMYAINRGLSADELRKQAAEAGYPEDVIERAVGELGQPSDTLADFEF